MSNVDAFTCRNVERGPAFDDLATTVFKDLQVADLIVDAVMFVLARASDPTAYALLAGSSGSINVYCLKTRPAAAWPQVAIFFTFDERKITLWSINPTSTTAPGQD